MWPNLWPDVSDDPQLTAHQKERVAWATRSKVGILSGSPGTGKTFSAAALIRKVIEQYGVESVRLGCPTGKAAVRLSQAMHLREIDLKATTIHRLLQIGRNGHDGKGWGFRCNQDNPLPYQFLVIDESSMLGTSLMASLLDACKPGTHILFLGDVFQLSPVEHGAPLRDMLAAGVPHGELTEIQRNAGQIVHACLRIKNGESFDTSDNYEPETGKNLIHLSADTEADSIRLLEALLRSMKRFDPAWGCQVLVGVNAKSGLSRKVINERLHGLLNPDGLQIAGNQFKIGDKVICLKNSRLTQVGPPGRQDELDDYLERGGSSRPAIPADTEPLPTDAGLYKPVTDEDGQPYEIYVANGEIGRVVAVAPGVTVARMGEADELVRVPMGKKQREEEEEEDGNGKGGEGTKGKLFDLAYAITTHKAQGSEAPCVIILADPQAGQVAERHWWYTAISRASKLCIVIGNRGVVDRQRLRMSLVKRKTFLVEELAALKDVSTDPAHA